MKKKKAVKKKKVVKKPKLQKNALKEALSDIDSEIKSMGVEKKLLASQMEGADKNLESFREFEVKLQQKIADLLEKEAQTKEKRKEIALNQEKLTEKLSRVQRVKTELEEI